MKIIDKIKSSIACYRAIRSAKKEEKIPFRLSCYTFRIKVYADYLAKELDAIGIENYLIVKYLTRYQNNYLDLKLVRLTVYFNSNEDMNLFKATADLNEDFSEALEFKLIDNFIPNLSSQETLEILGAKDGKRI